MIINPKSASILMKNQNNDESNYFQLSFSNLNNQSRNINNDLQNKYMNKKYSLYSTKETTPRKEFNKVLKLSTTKNGIQNSNKEKENIKLDDDLSNLSSVLKTSKKNLNYSELVGKIPGLDDEPNFVFDQILYNKSKIKKAKLLLNKIGTLKLPVSNISSKEALTNSGREKKCFSDRQNSNEGLKKNTNKNYFVDVSCCIFGKKS